MKKITILMAAALMLLPSCKYEFRGVVASGDLVTKDYDVSAFESVDSEIASDIVYTGGDCAVSIESSDNILEHVDLYVKDGCLHITSDGVNFRDLKKFKVSLKSPVLHSLTVKGAVDFNAPEGLYGGDNFSMEIKGAGDVDIKGLDAKKVDVTVKGAGDLDLDGIVAETVNFGIYGAGDLNLNGLKCSSIDILVAGSGDCEVSGEALKGNLKVKGVGSLDAKGLKCEDLQTSVEGLGNIEKNR